MKSSYILISFFALLAVKPAKSMQRDTIYKFGDFLIESFGKTNIDFIQKNKPLKLRTSKGDTLYEDEKYLILGEDDKISTSGIYKKYHLKHRFSDFPVTVYKGKMAKPNFKTDTAAYYFRTRIRDGCKNAGINFAGHYTIVEWGCGSPCQQIAIVDRINGKIYYSSVSGINNTIAYGFTSSPNSRMLILNSDLLDRHKGYVYCLGLVKVEAFEWIDAKARRLPE